MRTITTTRIDLSVTTICSLIAFAFAEEDEEKVACLNSEGLSVWRKRSADEQVVIGDEEMCVDSDVR